MAPAAAPNPATASSPAAAGAAPRLLNASGRVHRPAIVARAQAYRGHGLPWANAMRRAHHDARAQRQPQGGLHA